MTSPYVIVSPNCRIVVKSNYFIHALKTSGAFLYLKVLLEYILGSPLERHPWTLLSLETVALLKGHERQWCMLPYTYTVVGTTMLISQLRRRGPPQWLSGRAFGSHAGVRGLNPGGSRFKSLKQVVTATQPKSTISGR